jgi:hypothetical protein
MSTLLGDLLQYVGNVATFDVSLGFSRQHRLATHQWNGYVFLPHSGYSSDLNQATAGHQSWGN